jgi:hypothetical protein
MFSRLSNPPPEDVRGWTPGVTTQPQPDFNFAASCSPKNVNNSLDPADEKKTFQASGKTRKPDKQLGKNWRVQQPRSSNRHAEKPVLVGKRAGLFGMYVRA